MFKYKAKYLVPIFILFLILCRFVVEIEDDKTHGDRFLVAKIIDGDTFELAGGDRLRLLGIDCPERGEIFFDSAVVLLENMILNRSVKVGFSTRRRDGYGRILGYVFLDTIFVNAALLRYGLANVYLFKDNLNDHSTIKQLLNAQEYAIENNLGIWSVEYPGESHYLSKKGSLRFHRPHCASINNLDFNETIRFLDRIEAFKAGYSPCRNCKP